MKVKSITIYPCTTYTRLEISETKRKNEQVKANPVFYIGLDDFALAKVNGNVFIYDQNEKKYSVNPYPSSENDIFKLEESDSLCSYISATTTISDHTHILGIINPIWNNIGHWLVEQLPQITLASTQVENFLVFGNLGPTMKQRCIEGHAIFAKRVSLARRYVHKPNWRIRHE